MFPWLNPRVNCIVISGETALHNAIRSGHSGNLHTIKMLLARAADVSVLNAVGETPLHVPNSAPFT